MLYIAVFAHGEKLQVVSFYANNNEAAEFAAKSRKPAGYSLQYVALVTAN